MGDSAGNGIGAGSYTASREGIGRGTGDGDESGNRIDNSPPFGAGAQGRFDGNNQTLWSPVGDGSYY